ncbi:Protoporphyrinogen oxidase [Sistotremastrum suecicum HHB10207 ss-3]|uniref:Protoporphyrinogen oxidase n=1 Tax=Sistotremastrum suecicum HHB10207 ss-3 TaxID=1314776 RepID=A0A166BAX3_9AGAM|nr:Protoporphyrinogen oxidase [Sistotremastrum suecicum HHB10207 ss-3]
MPPTHVAVLGGGITGLTSAFHLARRFPKTQITVFESNSRLGGWVRSQRKKIEQNKASVLLESGPRTLRPNSKALLELINLLNLKPHVLKTSTSAPAAKNRFLHIPGSQGLSILPSSLSTLFKSPVSSLLVGSVLKDLIRPPNRGQSSKEQDDESVDSFLSRRFGDDFARVMGSALVHGIYAADSRILSIRSAFPSLWKAHIRGTGSVARSMLLRPFLPKEKDEGTPKAEYELGDTEEFMKGVSVFSFVNGIQDLTTGLAKRLDEMPNVAIKNDGVSSLEPTTGGFAITLDSSQVAETSHVVSALPLPILSKVLTNEGGAPSLPHLNSNPSSSVTVVNFVFDSPPDNIHPAGFGYLIPRPSDSNSSPRGIESCMLGTVFDSSSLAAQDSSPTLTKLTVMLGGPHPLPKDGVSIPELLSVLSSHLQRKLPEPILSNVRVQRDCIPIPTVGHWKRMKELKETLSADPWRGKMEVVGAGVGGVSIGDCIEAGRNAGRAWL